MAKREEMVKVGCNCARSVCWCSEGRIVKKSWAWSHDKPYRILAEQPMTLKERREQQAIQAEIECRRVRLKGSYTLNKDAKDRIFAQTGQHFDDYGQYKEWCKVNGYRDLEKGENATENRKMFLDWVKSGRQGPSPFAPPLSGKDEDKSEAASERMERMRSTGELRHRMERMGIRESDRFVLTQDGNFARIPN